MNQRMGILVTCLVFSFFTVRLLLDEDVSAQILYLALAIVIGRMLTAVIFTYLPIELLPNLDKKAIFITGCDSGFGHLAAQRLDSLGATVYATCLFPEGEGAMALKKTCSSRIHIVPLDVRSDKQVEDALKYTTDTLGEKVLWAVVNNAGIANFSEIEWQTIADIQNILDVNVFGGVRVTKAFLPLLRESKGRIVNLNSLASSTTLAGIVPYCASKMASLSFTEGFRQELKKFSISVHSVEPSFYMTPILQTIYKSDIWNKCPKHIKDAYGEDYYEKYQARMDFLLRNFMTPSNRLNDVVDCIVEASVGTHPKDNYVPALLDKLWKMIALYAPEDLVYFFKTSVILPSNLLPDWIIQKYYNKNKHTDY